MTVGYTVTVELYRPPGEDAVKPHNRLPFISEEEEICLFSSVCRGYFGLHGLLLPCRAVTAVVISIMT